MTIDDFNETVGTPRSRRRGPRTLAGPRLRRARPPPGAGRRRARRRRGDPRSKRSRTCGSRDFASSFHRLFSAEFRADSRRCSRMTRIVVIDPQPAVRAGLAMMLRTEPGLVPVGVPPWVPTTGSSWSRASARTSSCSTRSCSTATGSARAGACGRSTPRRASCSTPRAATRRCRHRARRGRRRARRQGGAGRGALRGDPRSSRAAGPRCRRWAARSSTPPRTGRRRGPGAAGDARRPHRARRGRGDAAAGPARAWRGASSACSGACARARARRRARARGSTVRGVHASRPHGHRAHRPWRARIRHLLAAAERADHLPRLGGRRSGREPGRRPDAAPGVPGPRQGHLDLHQLARRLDLRRAWRSTTR